MRQFLARTTPLIAAVAAGAVLFSLPVASVAGPAVNEVHAQYVVNGHNVGSGTAVEYGGQPYISLAAVKALTGSQVTWDRQTATLSTGTGTATPGAGGPYLEDLPGQPYYVSSEALCWQVSTGTTQGKMHSPYASKPISPCNEGLSKHPVVLGQSYPHSIAMLVSADGHKSPDAKNTIIADYALAGHYLTLSGTAGLVDTPFNRTAMELTLLGDGKVLGSAVIAPGALPAPFKVSVARVQQLSVRVSNVSGAAPNLESACCFQYVPGAVVIANPRLTP